MKKMVLYVTLITLFIGLSFGTPSAKAATSKFTLLPPVGTSVYFEGPNSSYQFFAMTYAERKDGYTRIKYETGSVSTQYSYVVYENKNGFYRVDKSDGDIDKKLNISKVKKLHKTLLIKYPVKNGNKVKLHGSVFKVMDHSIKLTLDHKTIKNVIKLNEYENGKLINSNYYAPSLGFVKAVGKSEGYINYSAKNITYPKKPFVDKTFVSLAKQGQIKGVPGKIGTKYSTLKKVDKGGKVYQVEGYANLTYQTKKHYYFFVPTSVYSGATIKSDQKVVMFTTHIPTTSISTFKKYFGNPVANDIYRAGKYFILVSNENAKVNEITIGTKQAINGYFSAPEPGDLIP
jgi:hypothetical protein